MDHHGRNRRDPFRPLFLHAHQIAGSQNRDRKPGAPAQQDAGIASAPASPGGALPFFQKNKRQDSKAGQHQQIHQCRDIIAAHGGKREQDRRRLLPRRNSVPAQIPQKERGQDQQHAEKGQIIHGAVPPEEHIQCPRNQLDHCKGEKPCRNAPAHAAAFSVLQQLSPENPIGENQKAHQQIGDQRIPAIAQCHRIHRSQQNRRIAPLPGRIAPMQLPADALQQSREPALHPAVMRSVRKGEIIRTRMIVKRKDCQRNQAQNEQPSEKAIPKAKVPLLFSAEWVFACSRLTHLRLLPLSISETISEIRIHERRGCI